MFFPQWESRKGQGWKVQPFLDPILWAGRLSRDLVPFFPRVRILITETHKEGRLSKHLIDLLFCSVTEPSVFLEHEINPKNREQFGVEHRKEHTVKNRMELHGIPNPADLYIVPLNYREDNTSFLRLFWILYELVYVKAPSSLCDFNKHISVRSFWPLLCLPTPGLMHTLLPLWCYCSRNASAEISLTWGLHCVKTKSIFTRQLSSPPRHLRLPILLSSSAVSSSLR